MNAVIAYHSSENRKLFYPLEGALFLLGIAGFLIWRLPVALEFYTAAACLLLGTLSFSRRFAFLSANLVSRRRQMLGYALSTAPLALLMGALHMAAAQVLSRAGGYESLFYRQFWGVFTQSSAGGESLLVSNATYLLLGTLWTSLWFFACILLGRWLVMSVMVEQTPGTVFAYPINVIVVMVFLSVLINLGTSSVLMKDQAFLSALFDFSSPVQSIAFLLAVSVLFYLLCYSWSGLAVLGRKNVWYPLIMSSSILLAVVVVFGMNSFSAGGLQNDGFLPSGAPAEETQLKMTAVKAEGAPFEAYLLEDSSYEYQLMGVRGVDDTDPVKLAVVEQLAYQGASPVLVEGERNLYIVFESKQAGGEKIKQNPGGDLTVETWQNLSALFLYDKERQEVHSVKGPGGKDFLFAGCAELNGSLFYLGEKGKRQGDVWVDTQSYLVWNNEEIKFDSPIRGGSALSIRPCAGKDAVYFPTVDGIWRFDTQTGRAEQIRKENYRDYTKVELYTHGDGFVLLKYRPREPASPSSPDSLRVELLDSRLQTARTWTAPKDVYRASVGKNSLMLTLWKTAKTPEEEETCYFELISLDDFSSEPVIYSWTFYRVENIGETLKRGGQLQWRYIPGWDSYALLDNSSLYTWENGGEDGDRVTS